MIQTRKKRRLRNLKQILFPSNSKKDYYSFSIYTLNNTEIISSKDEEELDLIDFKDTSFILRIYSSQSKLLSLVVVVVVVELYVYSFDGLSLYPEEEGLTVGFVFDDGQVLYSNSNYDDVDDDASTTTTTTTTTTATISKMSYTFTNVSHIIKKQSFLYSIDDSIRELKDSICSLRKEYEMVKRVELIKQSVNMLKEKTKKRSLSSSSSSAAAAASAAKIQLPTNIPLLNSLKAKVAKLDLLNSRLDTLVLDNVVSLQFIYPLLQQDSSLYTIRGLATYSNTSFLYVAHLVSLIAKYYSIQLPFPIHNTSYLYDFIFSLNATAAAAAATTGTTAATASLQEFILESKKYSLLSTVVSDRVLYGRLLLRKDIEYLYTQLGFPLPVEKVEDDLVRLMYEFYKMLYKQQSF